MSAAPPSRRHAATERILTAALAVFGRDGYAGATTRRIAADAAVALPSIKYYFGSKEGLYLACAQEIVDRYEADVGEFVRSVLADLEGGCPPEVARSHLKQVIRRVTAIAGDEGADLRTAFVRQEMADRGPAFDLLYRDLWRPGVLLTAALVARVEHKPAPDRSAHLQALLLHASVAGFSAVRPVSERYLDDTGGGDGTDVDPEEVLAEIDAQIDRLGAGSR